MLSLLKKRNQINQYVIVITSCWILLFLGCGGGDSEEMDVTSSTLTATGIDFSHNNFYTEDELTQALVEVDDYLEMALDCAKTAYPDMADVIDSVPANDLHIVVMFPEFFDSEIGREGFQCKSAKSGNCTGEYRIGRSTILITPSLDALGHEMSHWINDMIFGSTSHDDPDDLTNLCPIAPVCHSYSSNRNLIACRN
ncbi:MAG TPA: hypothetical protein VGA95_00630 [Thermodesulfobacteriota bacterium]